MKKEILLIGSILVLLVFSNFVYSFIHDSFDAGGSLADRTTAAETKIYNFLELHDEYTVVNQQCYFNVEEGNYYFLIEFTATLTNQEGIILDSSNTAVVISSINLNFNTGHLYYITNFDNNDALYTGYINAVTSGVSCEMAEEYLENIANQESEQELEQDN